MFGLLDYENVEKFNLLSVSVDCDVRNLLVSCSSSFVYKNLSGHDTEALFSFPLHGSCAVYSLEAIINDKKIVGVCKEIEEARNMYNVAKEAGHKAVYIERNTSMSDVFTCRIGNLPNNTTATITLKFTMELTLSLEQSKSDEVNRFNLSLPLILKPRYSPVDYVGDTEVYHVMNKYEYNFQSLITGTKEISNVFSNNYALEQILVDDQKLCVKVVLVSEFDGSHDLDINIDYIKMKVPSVLYEYGSASKHFQGKPRHSAFYNNDVAMLNFLPDFNKNIGEKKKAEIIFVIDRSGSMAGACIQNAKECLLIFLKSLPINCKFQVYGFGSSFDKAFQQPCIYDERAIEIALTYQRNIQADFGGTELMNPLQDIYQSSLASDYTRVVFLLTDGAVDNQDEVFKLVRQHNHSTRLFTVGIGDGVSTSLVQKVAESGLGKAVFVRNTKTLSSSVIELLDVALHCHQFSDCKIEWQRPSHVSIEMVPSNIGPIFSNYFLTMFCMTHGMKDGDVIKCFLSGKVNGSLIRMELDFTNKNGVSDDEFRVHRLLAKYKIDELSPQIEDGNEHLKKSLIELSLAVNMVTNYTTFVAIDLDTPDKGLTVVQEEAYNWDCCDMGFDGGGFDQVDGPRMGFDGGGFDQVDGPRMMFDDECEETKEMCFQLKSSSSIQDESDAACGYKVIIYIAILSYILGGTVATSRNAVYDNCDIVLFLADHQSFLGFWKFDEDVILRIGCDTAKVKQEKPDTVSNDAWMTAIVYLYLVERLSSREKEWRLLAKKAKEWLENDINNRALVDQVIATGFFVV